MSTVDAPAPDHDVGGPPEEDDADVEEPALGEPRGVWLTWRQIVALVAAVGFLGGAVMYYLDGRSAQAGAVDMGFYQDMTTHHDQAVELALLELRRGENRSVLTFAEEILIFQNRELGTMATRLADWGESPSNRPDTAMGWMGMETAPETMPGMATEEQIAALEAARGTDADVLFLQLMAEHHRGGLHMASYAAENAAKGEVRELAGRMARFQAIEVNEMAQTAERLGLDVDIELVEVPPEPDR